MATVIVPPFDKSGAPVGPPFTAVAPPIPIVNTATTRQVAAALPNTGHLQLAVGGDVNLLLGKGDAATTAAPFFQGCIEVQTSQNYQFDFVFDYDFDVRLDGGLIGPFWKIRGQKISALATRAIAEVFDRTGVLVGDAWMSPYSNWVIFRSIRKRIVGNSALTISVPLVKTMTYYWKFTFLATVDASVRTLVPGDATCEVLAMPAVAGGGKKPAPPPAAGPRAGMFLKTVTINPNVFPFKCP